MKKSIIWIILFVLLIIGIAVFWYSKTLSKNKFSSISNTNTTQNVQTNSQTNEVSTINEVANATNTNRSNPNSVERTNTIVKGAFQETILSTFSTPIKSAPEGRLNNIRITSKKLDGYIIENGATFSFNQVVGKPTSAEGYKEAEVIIDGKFEQAIGGGNCQVSTSIYNAALQTEGVEVTERHEHGRRVNYVEAGKDATVSYGSLDLKFVNNTGKTLKLHVGTDDTYVTAQLGAIS